jgi:hypothetical protein
MYNLYIMKKAYNNNKQKYKTKDKPQPWQKQAIHDITKEQ